MEDNTFAIVQYDTTWSSDLVSPQAYSTSANVNQPATKSGYAGLIPKFLKCQKVYTPTPLATLQKLSIRLERHDQSLLSDSSDVLQINQICFGRTLTAFGSGSAATNYGNSTSDYIFLQTSTYLFFCAVGEGDTLSIQGVSIPRGGSVLETTFVDFESFINAEQYVVAVGVADGTNLTLNANNAGYANCIILRNRFVNPTTGTIARSNFGGNTTQDDALATQLNASTSLTGAALLNVSRQTHIVLRIITRDMDSGSNIRPDNV
jgi:hypothetical protein